MKPQNDHEREYFLAGLKMARRHGLGWEFTQFYKRARRKGDSVIEATRYALYEWDIA